MIPAHWQHLHDQEHWHQVGWLCWCGEYVADAEGAQKDVHFASCGVGRPLYEKRPTP